MAEGTIRNCWSFWCVWISFPYNEVCELKCYILRKKVLKDIASTFMFGGKEEKEEKRENQENIENSLPSLFSAFSLLCLLSSLHSLFSAFSSKKYLKVSRVHLCLERTERTKRTLCFLCILCFLCLLSAAALLVPVCLLYKKVLKDIASTLWSIFF